MQTIATHCHDQTQRRLALDPTQSFIVRAPAGSGKTELLIQRFLVMLARVQHPEHVLALTFTRKAASEMRNRVLSALLKATQENQPQDPLQKQRWLLAKKVLQQNDHYHWNLLENPNQLSIQTIDSLCLRFVQNMPITSGIGTQPRISEHPDRLYRASVHNLFNDLETNQTWTPSLIHLLTHLDMNYQKAEALLITMLKRREQWLEIICKPTTRIYLESGLKAVRHDLLSCLKCTITEEQRQQLTQLIQYAQNPSQDNAMDDETDFWSACATLFLTKEKRWRKQWTAREGFHAKNASSSKMKRLIQDLSTQVRETLEKPLIEFANAPPAHYTDEQWNILNDLFTLLPVLTAYLQVTFQQHNQIDYNELTLRAHLALDAHLPSDLALGLAQQIQHILVDEFQDTSLSQFRFLEKLLTLWDANDQRSLFLVGDPMQSIYRFRKAQVGLFAHVCQFGMAHLQLTPLYLNTNFRSHQVLIDWQNQIFNHLVTELDTVSFTPAYAWRQEDLDHTMVQHHWFTDPQTEGITIAQLIQTLQTQDPLGSVALLIRSRSALHSIIPALQQAGIVYSAVGIDPLAHKPIISDLKALTRALIDPSDEIAWLAVLRAPYCGLSLCDLHALAHQRNTTLLARCEQFMDLSLSTDAKSRLQRIMPTLHRAFSERGRISLARWIEKTWILLGGPTCLEEQDVTDVYTFFDRLHFISEKHSGPVQLIEQLEEELNTCYVDSLQSQARIEIMTLHKAKGLEFDHVILPGLHRSIRRDEEPLLFYSDYLSAQHKQYLLLAPIYSNTKDTDPIYAYLKRQDKQQQIQEAKRLLYVAATRARKSLHTVARVQYDAQQVIPPKSDCLLSYLWPYLKVPKAIPNTTKNPKLKQPKPLLKRLQSDWKNPIALREKENVNLNQPWSWQVKTEQIIGTVIHRLLYHISDEGLAHWSIECIQTRDAQIRSLLIHYGISKNFELQAVERVTHALIKTLQDPIGRWILSKHLEDQSEFSVSDPQQDHIIDRTFLDHTGIRWIIDYKVSMQPIDDIPVFLCQQRAQHAQQLTRYATLIRQMHNEPIYLGLYFPLSGLWDYWRYQP